MRRRYIPLTGAGGTSNEKALLDGAVSSSPGRPRRTDTALAALAASQHQQPMSLLPQRPAAVGAGLAGAGYSAPALYDDV